MVFVAKQPSTRQALDLPLVYIRSDKFNQPFFGCNNLSGEVWPVRADGGPTGSHPPLPYKLFFLEGGVGTFLPLYFTFVNAARQADRNRRNSAVALSQVQVQEHMQQAFVDPSDPTSLFLTQPVTATTQAAPQYAANYGQDEKYAPLI
jgi:WW domain-binding protein 2